MFTYQPTEVATVLAGSGVSGIVNGQGKAASFTGIVGLTADASGNVYVAQQSNHLIRKINASGLVTTFAGSGTGGAADGNGTAASFNLPSGLVTDAGGNVYVADKGNGLVRKITPAGGVSTLTLDASGMHKSYGMPYYVAVDGGENIFFTDLAGDIIQEITPGGNVVTAFTANNPSSGFYGLASDKTGDLFVAYGGAIYKISSGNMSVFANPSFTDPYNITIDGSGNLYVMYLQSTQVAMISNSGVVTDIGNSSGLLYEGPVNKVSFTGLTAIAADPAGNIYVADDEYTIPKISVQ